MNNTMIPILPELKSAMKQVTKQYQSDFDLDTKVIQKAAKEAKAGPTLRGNLTRI